MNQEQTKQLIELVDKYCESYGITRKDLFVTSGGKKRKVIGPVSLSTMRMALGHYIYHNYPVTLTQIARIIGYNDHSVISYHYTKIKNYIKNNDIVFMSYYNNLLEVAKEYPPHIKIQRVPYKNFIVLPKTNV
jgi:chromosomal replication initiation ATPase DnaA